MVTRTDLLVYTKLNHLLKVGEESQNNYMLGLPSDHGIDVRSRENDHMMVKVLTMILIMLTMILEMIVRTMITGRGLKAAGRYKRFRDLYCVVEVQLIDYHRKYEHYHHKQPANN